MALTQVLGLDCKLYFNDILTGGAGTISVPVWVELDIIKDATLNIGYAEADTSNRGSGGIETAEPTLLQVSVEGNLQWLNDDATGGQAIWDALWNREAIDLLCVTGADDDAIAVGVRGDFKVFQFPQKQELADIVRHDVTLKPVKSVRDNNLARYGAGAA
jgi:hypothetical protein